MSKTVKKILQFFEIEEVEQTGKPPAKTEVKPVPESEPEPSIEQEKPEPIELATIGEEGKRRRIKIE